MKLPSAEEMQALDRCAIEEYGVPGIVLMENAGSGTVQLMRRVLGDCRHSFACIFIGPGNNGGDGFVIGRHLWQQGCQPVFLMLVDPERLAGDAACNYRIAEKLGLPLIRLHTRLLGSTIEEMCREMHAAGLRPYAIVDAIFGVGLRRQVEGIFADAITWINTARLRDKVPVVAVDCPSGLNLNSGRIQGCCVQADYTACYAYAQPGHYMADGKQVCGELSIIDIGLPRPAIEQTAIPTQLSSASLVARLAAKLRRPADSHKGDTGHLLAIAGSPGKSGAAILALRGALHSGCGLVSLMSPSVLNPIYQSALAEAMTIVVPGSTLTIAHTAQILNACLGKKAVLLGPGLGLGQLTQELVLRLYLEIPLPMVVDADAISILAQHREALPQAANARIFTPHPGEMGRLLGCSAAEVQQDRLQAVDTAMALLNRHYQKHVLVLKGAGSVIATPDRQRYINPTGNAGMACGGMGDVLAGIIGGLLCQGLSADKAAITGVYLHGAAADQLYQRCGTGYLASAVAAQLPMALQEVLASSDAG